MVSNMTTYWRQHPPMHILLAGYVGFKPEMEINSAENLNEAVAEFAADFGDNLPEHLRGALDAFNPKMSD